MLGAAAVLYGATLAGASAVAAEPAMRYIAVILPAKSQNKAFKLAADSIKAGLKAADKVHGGHKTYPMRVFDVDEREDSTLAAFNQAQSEGAVAVVGPLTRSAVNYLADSADLGVPVLALNSFDQDTLRRPKLYSFGLSIEAEVQQMVREMRSEKVSVPVVLKLENTLSTRMQRAFAEAWRAETGVEPAVISIRNAAEQANELQSRLGKADAVFFAMNGRNASLVRPYLPAHCQLYGTSQVAVGRTVPVDLAGIHYVEMPWLLNPEAPEFAAYPRELNRSDDEERLFALGVDAWWLVQLLARGENFSAVDGLTGWLRLQPDGVIVREMVPVQASAAVALAPPPADASQPASVVR